MASEMTFQVLDSVGEKHLSGLMTLYGQAWWATHRTREQVRRLLEHSSVTVGVTDSRTGELAGFARVLTDFVFRAHIYDVIVREDCRGRGVSRMVMDAVIRHPRLKEVEKFELTCKEDLIPLYSKCGFEAGGHGLNFMSRAGESN